MLRGAARVAPSLFGFIKLTYLRTTAAGVFTLTAAAGISLSISDHSHREISYTGWYGAAIVALIVVLVTTSIIDRRLAASTQTTNQRGRRRVWPWGRPEVGKIHEQDLHDGLTAISQAVSRGEACGYGSFPIGASNHQRALAAHFSDLATTLGERDQVIARVQTALNIAHDEIKSAVLASTIPTGYDHDQIAEIISRFLVSGASGYRIVLRASPDVPGDKRWHVYLADGLGEEAKLATWPDEPIEQIKERSEADEATLQTIVETVRKPDSHSEITAGRIGLDALTQPLEDLLNLKQAVSPILFAKDCPYCQAQLQGASLPD
jgi:multisubunit Na+/H+ antiporter MnhG subunit